jgi:hypothetical protein
MLIMMVLTVIGLDSVLDLVLDSALETEMVTRGKANEDKCPSKQREGKQNPVLTRSSCPM